MEAEIASEVRALERAVRELVARVDKLDEKVSGVAETLERATRAEAEFVRRKREAALWAPPPQADAACALF